MGGRDLDAGYWGERLDRQVEQFRAGSAYAFSIFERATAADGPLLGYVNFSEVVRGVFLARYMGYALAETAQGRGYITEACRAAIGYIF